MAEYIEREALRAKAVYMHGFGENKYVPLKAIENAPSADVEVVVHCYECVLHGHCRVEDTFEFAEKANPFCCVGKRRANQWT